MTPQQRRPWTAHGLSRYHIASVALLIVGCGVLSAAQTLAVLQGRVFDASDAVLAGAAITIKDTATGLTVGVRSDPEGHYSVGAIPAGTYTVTVSASGFRTEIIEELSV